MLFIKKNCNELNKIVKVIKRYLYTKNSKVNQLKKEIKTWNE